MTPATATKTLHQQLADLQRRADQAHATAREAREAKTRYEVQVHELRARADQVEPGSRELAEIKAEITAREQSRIHSTGPHADAVRAAQEPFHAADLKLQAFKRGNLPALVAEIVAENLGDDTSELTTAFQTIVRFCGRYDQTRQAVENLVTSVTGMTWRDVTSSEHIDPWRTFASDALDVEVTLPRLTPSGEWKVQHQTDDLPAENEDA